MQEPAGELPYFAGQRRHQTTNLGVRSSNLFGRARKRLIPHTYSRSPDPRVSNLVPISYQIATSDLSFFWRYVLVQPISDADLQTWSAQVGPFLGCGSHQQRLLADGCTRTCISPAVSFPFFSFADRRSPCTACQWALGATSGKPTPG